MLKLVAVLISLLGAGCLAAPGSSPLITPQLESALVAGGTANVFISLKASTQGVLSSINNARFADRSTKLNALHAALRNHAARTQEPILSFLQKSRAAAQVTSFWVTNQIYVKNADRSLVNGLANEFPDLIASIDEEFFAHLIQPVNIKTNVSLSTNADNEWGVVKIQAPEAWAELGGVAHAGEGVVIATVDTGVRATHEALKDNFFGQYGWFDPSTADPTPTDNNGHGTHTTGTIAGGLGIGVAPKAKWSACRGCASFFCSQADLIACGQFFVCPTLADGSQPDCSKAPNLVSNSWGGGRGNTWYNGVIDAWHAAGIIPLFSIGNSGPSCNTANSPGDQNVIGVGSTTIDDEISYFSSVGPTSDGKMKPEIAAPGSDVISAYHTADDAYASLSGTSMACPHAAGTIALLQTRNKNLSYSQAKGLLLGNTDQDLTFSGRVCEGVEDNVFPNHVFGEGRINALKSVRAQTSQLGQ